MRTTLHKETIGVVLELGSSVRDKEKMPLSAHLILNQRLMDNDGNLCVTASTGFGGFLDGIDLLKSELESLANETILWLAQNIALRRARPSIVSNNNLHELPWVVVGGGVGVPANTPPPRHSRSLDFKRVSVPTKYCS